MNLKLILFLTLLTLGQTLHAQTLKDVEESSIAFADIDGDNDQDVLITGKNSSGDPVSELYTNDGQGNFSKVSDTPFEDVLESSIAFADIDGDNDQDVLITGQNNSGDPVTKLYINDGQANFSEVASTPFDAVLESSIAFADVDNDNDQDVLITGYNTLSEPVSKLYTNDGQGNFSKANNTPFVGVYFSDIAFADIDDDNDHDILITGQNNAGDPVSELYTNDGQGNFTKVDNTPFEDVKLSSIAFADVNGDSDKDVLMTGDFSSSGSDPITKLYINDGQGNFTDAGNTAFEAVQESSIAFADVDGDNDQDVLITGVNSSFNQISELYINDGNGGFSKAANTPFEGVLESSIAFADLDGDNDQDALITGFGPGNPISELYFNDGKGNFSKKTTGTFYPSSKRVNLLPYPNPTKGNHLYINYNPSGNGFVNIKIYDIDGNIIDRQQVFAGIGQQTLSIDIRSLSPGSYIIELCHENQKGLAKFTVY